MADFCSNCEEEYFDIDIQKISSKLRKGKIKTVGICEGCRLIAIEKTEDNKIFLHKEENKKKAAN